MTTIYPALPINAKIVSKKKTKKKKQKNAAGVSSDSRCRFNSRWIILIPAPSKPSIGIYIEAVHEQALFPPPT